MKKILLFMVTLVFSLVLLTGCGKDKPTTKAPTTSGVTTEAKVDDRAYFNFIIYEKDSDNTKLSDNKVVASYFVRYSEGTKNVSDALIKGEKNKYYFVEGGTDYLVLESSQYGLTYTKGYFENYSGCADNTEIDVSWSMTLGNGESLMTGISSTPLEGLNQYGFVIDGWR